MNGHALPLLNHNQFDIMGLMEYYNLGIDEVLKKLKSSRDGLKSREAARRLEEVGYNAVAVNGVPLWQRIIAPFANVMMGVLAVAGMLSILQGQTIEAIIVLVIMIVSAVIDWVQQYSTERILRSLRKKENDKVEVYRDGDVIAVPAENIVPGDIIILQEGQKVPADARVLESTHLNVDESMLTGESMSIRKSNAAIKGKKEVYDRSNMVFAGSFVVTGSGLCVVTATGNDTEFGQLAKLASGSVESPIQQKIDKLITNVVIAVFIMAALVMVLEIAQGQTFVEALEFVLAFAVSAVPESLPIAITVVLALGMRRMAEKRALVRNMRAIENVGLVTVVATDKTGTLTRNELRVQETWSPRFNEAAFALQTSFTMNDSKGKQGDPLDTALSHYLTKNKVGNPHQATRAELVRSLPFDYALAMSGNVWRFGKREDVYLKGAPEKLLARCSLNETARKQTDAKLHEYAKQGYRVIAVAKYESKGDVINLSNVPKEKLEFLGFLAIADELRPHIENAVREAQGAGARVVMITGDHAETAYNIAHKVGIADDPKQVYDSHKLMTLSPDQLASVVASTRVYARVTPEAKYKILDELNKSQITAMTGDGVNDVPALTKAHVGIAMGGGAAIAKDASDMVLLDNNFRSIVTAIREGRIIISNVRNMLLYLLATNAGEVLVTIGALLLGLPLPVLAVQILWINLATDTFMVIPLGLEPGARDIMKRKPLKPDAPILNKYLIGQMIVTSLTMAVIVLTVFYTFLHLNGGDPTDNEPIARSAAFLTLIVIQWVNAVLMRSLQPLGKILRIHNRSFFWALLGAMMLQLIALLTPALRDALYMADIHANTIWACLLASVTMVVVIETYKKWARYHIAREDK